MGAAEIAGNLAGTCIVVALFMAAIDSVAYFDDESLFYGVAGMVILTGVVSGIAWIWL